MHITRVTMITSLQNPQVRMITQLNTKAKARKKNGLFTAEGRKMFLEAPTDWICKVYLTEEAASDEEVSEKIRKKQLAVETVTAPVFGRMADTQTPQGILTVLRSPASDAEELVRKSMASGPGLQKARAPLWMVLENLQDPGNLGTILRTGEGAGIAGVLLTGSCVDMLSPKTVRATMGSIYRVPFAEVSDIGECAALLKRNGIRMYAAHLKGTNTYDMESYAGPSAFLIGNEGNGLSEEASEQADCLIRIPMLGRVESLNAAMAAGILMYEAARQHRTLE